MASPRTVVEVLAAALQRAGVKRMFGIPGGGSSLDLIEAAAHVGIDFVLARSESAAVIMAAVTGELDDTVGVALTGRGPGLANSVNGIAHASLDRSPVLVISDCLEASEEAWVTHQTFDQRAMVAPVTKAQLRLGATGAADEIDRLIRLSRTPPRGPTCIELSAAVASESAITATTPPAAILTHDSGDSAKGTDSADAAAVLALLAAARRPVVIAGLECRDPAGTAAVRALTERLECPTLTTYKAKGVFDSTAQRFVGLFTGGSAEAECVSEADLILLVGLDPVELIPQPWRYRAPVVSVASHRHDNGYCEPVAALYAPIAASLRHITSSARPGAWPAARIAELRSAMEARLDLRSGTALDARTVVEIAQEAAPPGHRLTVDAGAHMVSAMAYCHCQRPFDVLISNGLGTMAFALPAAIAAAMHDPDRVVIAVTGDGGLLMCLGELATAAERRCRLIVVVLNDGSLSLIDVKQRKRRLQSRGVRWPRVDFAQVMTGLGGVAYRASTRDEYRQAVRHGMAAALPALIDVRIDPSAYGHQLDALRG